MLKILGFVAGGFILAVMFIDPVRSYMNNLFKNKSELKEEQIIGSTSMPNPRVEEVQIILKGAYYDPGNVDGIMGIWTRKAISNFQKDKNLWPNGKVDYKTWLALNKEKEIINKEMTSRPLILPAEITVIAGLPEEVVKEKPVQDKKKQLQMALRNAKFYKGEIDGKIGPDTKRAIKAFQRARGLKADGVAGSLTWAELKEYLNDR